MITNRKPLTEVSMMISLNKQNYDANTGIFTYKFSSEQDLTNAQVAFVNASLYNSFFNVSTRYDNNVIFFTFPYNNSTGMPVTFSWTIPDGYYSIDELSLWLNNQCLLYGFYATDSNTSTPLFFLFLSSNTNTYSGQISYYLVQQNSTLTLSPGVPMAALNNINIWSSTGINLNSWSFPTSSQSTLTPLITWRTTKTPDTYTFGDLLGFYPIPSNFPSSVPEFTGSIVKSATAIIKGSIFPNSSCQFDGWIDYGILTVYQILSGTIQIGQVLQGQFIENNPIVLGLEIGGNGNTWLISVPQTNNTKQTINGNPFNNNYGILVVNSFTGNIEANQTLTGNGIVIPTTIISNIYTESSGSSLPDLYIVSNNSTISTPTISGTSTINASSNSNYGILTVSSILNNGTLAINDIITGMGITDNPYIVQQTSATTYLISSNNIAVSNITMKGYPQLMTETNQLLSNGTPNINIVSSINFACSLVQNIGISNPSSLFYSLALTGSFGSLITSPSMGILYSNVSGTRHNSIEIRLYDQNLRLLYLKDSDVNFQINIIKRINI